MLRRVSRERNVFHQKCQIIFIDWFHFEGEESKPEKKEIDSFDIDIAPENTAYCYVLRPDESKTAFPQHENCEFPKFNSESEGNGIWHVVSGVKGKTQEVSFQVNVQATGKQSNQWEKADEMNDMMYVCVCISYLSIAVEELKTFVEHNSGTLSMKCKLENTKKTLKFCRFLRLNDDVGFNLQDGRGEEHISYYGRGFDKHECGISIANADESDKSPWKCFMGVDDSGKLETMGAIIDGSDQQKTSTQGTSYY